MRPNCAGDVVDHRGCGQVHDHVSFGSRSSAASTASASTSSLSSTWPVSSMTASRSPSGSWANPMSQSVLPNQLREVAKRVGPRFGIPGNGLRGIDGDGVQVAAERVRQKAGSHHRSGAIYCIQRDAELPAAYAVRIDVLQHARDVQLLRRLVVLERTARISALLAW